MSSVERPSFDGADLLEQVSTDVGLSDFGPDDFRPGFDMLLATYRRAPLSELGFRVKLSYLRRLLRTRLEVAAALSASPVIADRPVVAPMYIVGLARTGTTLLHRMLAEAAGLRTLMRWEGLYPAARAGHGAGEDPRLAAARRQGHDPRFDAIREVRADLPEEDYLLLEPSMRFASGGEHLWEPFRSWYATADQRPAYDYLAILIRLLDAQGPGGRWLMKSPAHLGHLDMLVERFPDVRLVWTHRDPVEAVASLCSLMVRSLTPLATTDPLTAGSLIAEGCVSQVERALAVRDQLGDDLFVDVDYRQLVADPARVAADVADRVGLEVTPELTEALRRYAKGHPQNAHGVHQYTPEQFGLEVKALRERFATYTQRFDLPR